MMYPLTLAIAKPHPGETVKAWHARTTKARQNYHNHETYTWPELGKDGRLAMQIVKNALDSGKENQVIDL